MNTLYRDVQTTDSGGSHPDVKCTCEELSKQRQLCPVCDKEKYDLWRKDLDTLKSDKPSSHSDTSQGIEQEIDNYLQKEYPNGAINYGLIRGDLIHFVTKYTALLKEKAKVNSKLETLYLTECGDSNELRKEVFQLKDQIQQLQRELKTVRQLIEEKPTDWDTLTAKEKLKWLWLVNGGERSNWKYEAQIRKLQTQLSQSFSIEQIGKVMFEMGHSAADLITNLKNKKEGV